MICSERPLNRDPPSAQSKPTEYVCASTKTASVPWACGDGILENLPRESALTSTEAVVAMEDMGAQCKFCRGRIFRRSRFKVKDLWGLLILRYPVRCLVCSKRQRVTVVVARKARSSKLRQVRAARELNPWANWSSGAGPGRENLSPSAGSGSEGVLKRGLVEMPLLQSDAPTAPSSLDR